MAFGAPAGLHSSFSFFTVTPDDDADLLDACRAVRVAVGGDLTVMRIDGETETIPGLLDGETVNIVARRIMDTGTTAQGITVFY